MHLQPAQAGRGALHDPRYEKTLRNYAAVVTLGCVMLWLWL